VRGHHSNEDEDAIELCVFEDASKNLLIASHAESTQRGDMFDCFRGQLSVRAMSYLFDHIIPLQYTQMSSLSLTDGVLDNARSAILADGLHIYGHVLHTLDLSRNDLGDDNFELLIDRVFHIGALPKLQTLRLASNGLGTLAVALLCCDYVHFAELRELDLCDNPLTNEAAVNLSLFISSNRLHIQSLLVCRTGFNSKSIALLEALHLKMLSC
jgi:hypothetical protein